MNIYKTGNEWHAEIENVHASDVTASKAMTRAILQLGKRKTWTKLTGCFRKEYRQNNTIKEL